MTTLSEIRAFMRSLRGEKLDAFIGGMLSSALIMIAWVLFIEVLWG